MLECSAPKGVPDPSVHWTKDGQTLDVEEVNGRYDSVIDKSAGSRLLFCLMYTVAARPANFRRFSIHK